MCGLIHGREGLYFWILWYIMILQFCLETNNLKITNTVIFC